VEVVNDGPTSTFAARLLDVRGVPWTNYRVLHPSWEFGPEAEINIPGGGGTRRLKLASVLAEPKAFWFWTSQQGHTGAGSTYALDTAEEARIDFRLEVINTGASDEIRGYDGTIRIPGDSAEATFRLTEAAR
jgi:hypothetical protein